MEVVPDILLWLLPGCLGASSGTRGAIYVSTASDGLPRQVKSEFGGGLQLGQEQFMLISVNLTQNESFNEQHVKRVFKLFPALAKRLKRATFSSEGEPVFMCSREDNSNNVKLCRLEDDIAQNVWLGHRVDLQVPIVEFKTDTGSSSGISNALKMLAVAYPGIHVQVDAMCCDAWRAEGRGIARGSAISGCVRVEVVQLLTPTTTTETDDCADGGGGGTAPVLTGQLWHTDTRANGAGTVHVRPLPLTAEIGEQFRQAVSASKYPELARSNASVHLAVINGGPVKTLNCRTAAQKALDRLLASTKRCAKIERAYGRFAELDQILPMLGSAVARVLVHVATGDQRFQNADQPALGASITGKIAALWRTLYLPERREEY